MRALTGTSVFLVLLVLVVGADLIANAGRVHWGVTVAGVDVAGRSQDEAKALLDQAQAERAVHRVLLAAAEETLSVAAKDVGLSFDSTAAAQAAYRYGRTGHFLDDVSDRFRAVFGYAKVQARPVLDRKKTEAVLTKFARKVDVPAVDAAVVISESDATAKVTPSRKGTVLDLQATRLLLADAFASSTPRVDAPLKTASPRVSDADAETADEQARQMMSGPVDVSFESKKWTFSPEDVAGWISFRRPGEETSESAAATGNASGSGEASAPGKVAASGNAVASGTAASAASGGEQPVLEAFVDAKKAGPSILDKTHSVGRPAKDATFKVSGGEVTIVPSQDGMGPDIDGLVIELGQVLGDPERERVVELRTKRTKPKITTEKAKTMGIVERISRYTTTYAASNKPRVSNIHLLADAIDGTLIEPGGTFSFNGTVGPRTAAKGYQEAPAIVQGKLVPQLGGGICQVGTTLFNTVYESGLPVVERHNHSFYISHYPKGRDATVSWGGPDFKFRNDTKHWVLLVTAYSNSSLTIALYGTDPDYDVVSEVGQWQNEKPYPTEETKDPTLPQGARVVEDGGITGRTITVRRIVSKDGEVVREDSFRSVYRPKVEVVRVGTKPVASTASSSTTQPAN